jgi:uncharacterized membrane-anchored protein
MSKLPMITALFWIMKILATTLGETGGDLVAQTLNVGYFGSSLLFITLFAISLVAQLRVKKFHPALFWAVILATSTAGTTVARSCTGSPHSSRTPWVPPPAISWPTTRDSASSPAPSSSPLRSY